MTQDAIIQIRDLVNCFGVQCVHQGLNLDVKRGEVLGVVGGSGTGKSVLLRSIVGLRRPTDGKIHVFGKDLMALSGQSRAMVERRVGAIPIVDGDGRPIRATPARPAAPTITL